jgi:microcystin-dependent protein
MSSPFVAEIRIFPLNFAPTGWAFCNGQLLPISQNTALFSLLGTTYGGDGKSTFALPDMQGNVPMQPGQGGGLSLRDLGEISGTPTVTLLTSEMPIHTHLVNCMNGPGQSNDASNTIPSTGGWIVGSAFGVVQAYTATNANLVTMAPQAIAPAGGGLPHNNMQPYLTLNFCIALQGVFPPRG